MRVTVYIATKNRLPLLRRAIESVLGQTYSPIEIIVVDECSNDGSREYLLALQSEGKLKVILHQASFGACVARNSAINIASGEFITGLDDDDYFLPHRVESFVDAWRRLPNLGLDEVAGLFDSALVLTANGKAPRYQSQVVSFTELLEKNLIGNQVFAPREHYIRSGMFDPQMPMWQDWDLWLRMAKEHGRFLNINKTSYVTDESHKFQRVTAKPEFEIRYAKDLIARKHEIQDTQKRACLTVSVLSYPQVRPCVDDLYLLLRARRLRAFALFLLRRIKMQWSKQ